MNASQKTGRRIACYATAPFQFRALRPIAAAFPQSLLSLDAVEVKEWKPNAIVVTAEHEIELFRDFCTSGAIALFALRHGAGNKYIAPCREYALADYICGSEWDRQDFRRGGIIPLKSFLLTGNPWVDETFRLPPHTLNRKTPCVLFAPTWNPETSAARLLTDKLVPLVREVFPDSRVVIRPHPNILTYDHPYMKQHADLFQVWINDWKQAANDCSNVQFVDDKELPISQLFAGADILISDGSSLVYEFAALDRPILLYTSGEQVGYGEIDPQALANRYRDIGAEFRTEQEFSAALRGMFARHEREFSARQKELAQTLYGRHRDGQSTRRVIEAIESVLAGTPRFAAQQQPASNAAASSLTQQAGKALEKGDRAVAQKVLVEALTNAPHHVETIVSLANIFVAGDDFAAARRELTLALLLDPRNVPALSLLASVHLRHERVADAEDALRSVLLAQPHHHEARRLLALLAQQAGRFSEAIEKFTELVNANPNDAGAHVSLGCCQFHTGDLMAARESFERVLALDPANEEAKENLAVVSAKLVTKPSDGTSKEFTAEELERIPCPFCNSTDAEPFRHAADIVKCCGCQTVYLRTRMKIEAMEKLYQTYADEGSHLALPGNVARAADSWWKRDYLLQEILTLNPARGTLLDIGCSWGAFLLGARANGFSPAGIEITRKAVRYANEQLGIPVANTQFLDAPFAAGSVQVVTMIHVLEHLPQPKQAIAKAFDILKPDGLFCGIVPNLESYCSQLQGDDWYWLDPNYHYVHYSAATLRRHLEAAGFIVERIYTTRGDFDAERILRATGRDDYEFFEELEAKGQGEELRFFARKPASAAIVAAGDPVLPTVQKFDWPAVLDPFVHKHEGKYVYLDDGVLQHLELLSQVEPFYFHCGGAGDALLLFATFYDREPRSVLISYANSILATKSLCEAFPELQKVYFLPQHSNIQAHAQLRALMPTLANCKGMGVAPAGDHGTDWNEHTDIFNGCGVVAQPAWAKQFKVGAAAHRVVVAPRGSLVGMAGSKRNIIEPRDWPELLRFLIAQSHKPVIIGTPDERADYPCLDGCEDRRSFLFREQMQLIASSTMFVGADSWAKTFSALAGLPTFVFDPIKSLDWRGQKDPSDFVFLDPWDCIQVVSGLDHLKDVLTRDQPRSAEVTAPHKQTVHVAWEGTFRDNGSLSHVNRELTQQLARQPKVEVSRVGDGHRAEAPTRTQVTVRHAWPPDWRKPKFGAWLLVQPWEFGTLPAEWLPRLERVDEIWAPSEYVRRVYVDSGVAPSKVKVVPNGIDPERFRPDAKPMALPTKKSFKFLFVGGTIGRKGPDVLLNAYLKTFRATDDVCLVIKDFGGTGVYAGLTFEQQIKAAQAQPNAPEIVYINEDWPSDKLPSLYAACDCLVHPYRGEGFALPVLEAMACGLPVIVTRGGATDDFATEEFACHIGATRKRIGYKAGPFTLTRPGWLLEPSAEDLSDRMRWMTEHRDEARAKGRTASEHVRREWTWERAALVAANRLQELASRKYVKAVAPIQPPAPVAAVIPELPDNPRLSVCIIAKNEEKHLARCLGSVRGMAQQIVVVDTGSMDRTAEIAREHGAEVYTFVWNDNFGAARNEALAHATGDWVLTLDADEELSSASCESLLREMKSRTTLAYRLPIVDAGREEEGCHYVPRLFRNAPLVRYAGRVHEQVCGIAMKDWQLGKTTIVHHGYTPAQQHAKNTRNLRLLEMALRDQPNDPNLLMNLGLELTRVGRLGAGIEQYAEALKEMAKLPPDQVVPELRETLLTQLGTHLIAAKKYTEVVTLHRSPLARAGGLTASMHFTLGLALMQLQEFHDAAEEFRQCLAKRNHPTLCPASKDIHTIAPRHCLAVCLAKLKRLDAAEKEFRTALAENPKARDLRFEYAMFQVMRQQPVEALKILHELVAAKMDDAAAWAAGAQIALTHPDFLEFAGDWTAEAVKFCPADAFIAQQRAEVLLLSGKAQEALNLFRAGREPRSIAARVICEVATGEPIGPFSEAEAAVSQEFLSWYRRLVRWGARAVVLKVSENTQALKLGLPTAAVALEAVLNEACQSTAAQISVK